MFIFIRLIIMSIFVKCKKIKPYTNMMIFLCLPAHQNSKAKTANRKSILNEFSLRMLESITLNAGI